MVNTTYRVALDEADPDLPSGLTIGTSNPLLGVPVSGNSVTSDQDFGFDPAGSDLELSKIAAATGTTTPITNVSEGDTIDWIITITNVSGGSPSGVKVIDQIPSGFAYVSDDAPATGDTYDPDTGLWFVDELLSGESETLTITTTVLGSGDFTNQAEIIYSSLPDPDSDPSTGPLTDDLFDQLPDDDEASYSVTLVTGERILTGRVFIDNGADGGTAHDALRNGSEGGHLRRCWRSSTVVVRYWPPPVSRRMALGAMGSLAATAARSRSARSRRMITGRSRKRRPDCPIWSTPTRMTANSPSHLRLSAIAWGWTSVCCNCPV
nr:DUF11 domain-containing protein [Sulfitobacter faviae]